MAIAAWPIPRGLHRASTPWLVASRAQSAHLTATAVCGGMFAQCPRLPLPEQQSTRHDVSTFAWPGGQTVYGARCNRCGASWSVRNRKLARARLAIFREEECPAPDALSADQVETGAYDYWEAEAAEAPQRKELPPAPTPTPVNPRHRQVVYPLALVAAACLLLAGGWWLSGRASHPQPIAATTSVSTGLVEPPGFTALSADALPQGWLTKAVQKQERRWRQQHPRLARRNNIEGALVIQLLKHWVGMTPAVKRQNVHRYHQCLAKAQTRQNVIGCLRAAIK